MNKKIEYSLNLKFDSITIPPFKDILILGVNCPHGRLGMEKGFQLLSIDLFTVVEVKDHDIVSFIFINNYLLKKNTSRRNFRNFKRKCLSFYVRY